MSGARRFAPAGGEARQRFRAETSDVGVIAARSAIPKILLVDDEPHVVAGLRRQLSEYPYQVHTVTSAEHALQKLCEEPFDVIVADECMPGMQGSELLTVIAHEFPLTGRILLTGNGTISAAARAVNEAGVTRLLLKPCPITQLRDAIELALNVTPFEQRKTRSNARRAYLVSRRGARDSEGAAPSGETQAPAPPSTRRQQLTLRRQKNWEANELVLHAQKVMELQAQVLRGYELSTRLQAQAGNSHTVGNFVGAAGQHVPLSSVDRWVLCHVLKVVREHEAQLQEADLTVSLNIAASSLSDHDFVRFLDQELINSGVAQRILIELRESALTKAMRKDEHALAQLLALRCYEAGTRLCIDGVAGALWKMPFFSNLPLACAKIDSEAARSSIASAEAAALIGAAVSWGERTGVNIGATGVDSPAVLERLCALGVRYGQGNVFGAPEPVGLTLANQRR